MTQHTQPVVAIQHQHQQQQHQTSIQQQQTTTVSNSNNNNTSNNNLITTPTTSTTSNNQTQNVSIQQQQHPNNNNNNNSNANNNNNSYQSQQQTVAGGQIFNPQLQPSNVYVPTHSLPPHHHPQHHHQQPGPMYQTVIPTALPSNVYVNNVTANVNLHGWTHTVPPGAWVHPSGAPHYIHGDLPPEQGAPVIQSMPVSLPTQNALTGSVMNTNANTINSGVRGSRRGRGRGSTSTARRGDYIMQRHPPPEGSPAPQQSGQNNQQEMQQQQQVQQQTDAQQLLSTIPPSYLPHPQYATHAPQYQYAYPTFFASQQHMIHAGQSAAAQQATGTPIYLSAVPMYNGPHMYNYAYYLPHVINQSEHPYGEEVGVGDDRQTAGEGGAMIWHQQAMFSDEYGMNPADMHAVAADDHHNASSVGSANETPTMLSPTYPPLYEQMTQQMGVMQIYEDPQMGPLQIIHPQTGLPQMEEELSECGSQPAAPIQMVPPIQMVSAAAPPPMTLPAVTTEQLIHQQIPHLIPITDDTIMPIDGSIVTNVTPQHQIHQHGESIIESSLHTYENFSNIQQSESATNLNEDFVQHSGDNLKIACQSQPQAQAQAQPQTQQQEQQTQTQNIVLKSVQLENFNANKILATDAQELQENKINTYEVVPDVAQTNTNLAIEMPPANVDTERQQQPAYHQHSQEKHKQRHQYVAKQGVTQQHQQLQTQPISQPQHQQQQGIPRTQQSPQRNNYQPSTQAHYQTHHQAYENRKSSQMYNQHQSRSRKYEYHHGHGSSSNNNDTSSQLQQQQQPQQTTKTMSWTNSSQHKKSTNTVAVTAVPTTSHTSGSYNKQSNNQNSSNPHVHGTRSYTNQQHHNYQQQQQNYHYQQQQHQPQTRNYGAMKMPSSPISSAPNTMERKTSQSSDKAQTQQSTSTASITAAPHQFQQQHQQSQQTSTNDIVHTQPSPTAPNAATSTSTTIPSKQQSQQYIAGFTAKKHIFSNQGHVGASTNLSTSAMATSVTSTVEMIPSTPAINLAPPVTNITPTVPSTPSWASLFSNNSNTVSSSVSTTSTTASNPSASSSSSSTTTTYTKKPVAKVAPYEGLTPVTPPPPVVTPGTLSYSAASAQNLPPPTSTTAPVAKKTNSSEQQLQRNSLANLDEYTLKFAEFLTKYKNDWATISLRPRGLTNRSNYCYINSILQALIGCSPLYNLIRTIPKQAANLCEVKTPTINAMITLMSNFTNLPAGLRLRNAKGGKGNKDDLGSDLQCDSAFEPTEIYKLWNDSRKEHVEGRQEDAEEFLSYILNKLNDEMLEVIKLTASPNTEQNGQSEPQEEEGDVWQMICNNRNKGSVTRQTDFGRTPLSDIFRGELRSRLQREGEHSTDVIQPFFTLQLNIEKAASVKEALEILVGRDQLEGVTGSKSKQEVVAWQQMNLEKLPPILILHLKWFDYRSDGCTKILKKVEFPIELKIDAKILASKKYSQKQRAYRLFAVVYHDGKEATKGHYITDVYHSGYGSWLRYDDSSVKPVSENHVLLPRTPRVPYLLCYRRCDTIPQQNNNNGNNSPTGNNNLSGNSQSLSGK